MQNPDNNEKINVYQSNTVRVMHFAVQDLQCCLHIEDVERVIPLLEVRPIPSGPDYLLGLMNYHGSGIAVIDAGFRIGQPHAQAYSLDTPIILCSRDNIRIGLVVTDILDLQECQPQAFQMRPEFKQGAQPYEAVVSTSRGLSLLLDLERIADVQLGGIDIMSRLADTESYDLTAKGM
jgi:chemotaxis signal transduction protein